MPPGAEFSAAAVWEALSPAQRKALEEFAADAGMPVGTWAEVPALAGAFSTLALMRLARELGEARPGTPRKELVEAAAFRISMNEDSALTRWRRLPCHNEPDGLPGTCDHETT